MSLLLYAHEKCEYVHQETYTEIFITIQFIITTQVPTNSSVDKLNVI